MESALKQQLLACPPLDVATARLQALPCKICRAAAVPFDILDFNRVASVTEFYRFGWSGIMVPYYRCEQCGFLFTNHFDDWTDVEFADFVYNKDYIKVDGDYKEKRPRVVASLMAKILQDCKAARILDYGAGSGMFASEMSDLGFKNIYSYDRFSNPERPAGKFDLITCFEVIEHATNPIEIFEDMMAFLVDGGAILFSQTLQPKDINSLRGSWWYLAPRNGHVSTFTEHALSEIGRRLGLVFHSDGGGTFAAVRSGPSRFADLAARRVGPAFVSLSLNAPDTGPANDIWFGVEGRTPRFRWMRRRDVAWPLNPPTSGAAKLRIQIPVRHQIVPDFAERCGILVEGVEWPCQFTGGMIVAEGVITAKGPIEVRLRTPPLLSPARLRDSPDSRELGLAIATGSSGP